MAEHEEGKDQGQEERLTESEAMQEAAEEQEQAGASKDAPEEGGLKTEDGSPERRGAHSRSLHVKVRVGREGGEKMAAGERVRVEPMHSDEPNDTREVSWRELQQRTGWTRDELIRHAKRGQELQGKLPAVSEEASAGHGEEPEEPAVVEVAGADPISEISEEERADYEAMIPEFAQEPAEELPPVEQSEKRTLAEIARRVGQVQGATHYVGDKLAHVESRVASFDRSSGWRSAAACVLLGLVAIGAGITAWQAKALRQEVAAAKEALTTPASPSGLQEAPPAVVTASTGVATPPVAVRDLTAHQRINEVDSRLDQLSETTATLGRGLGEIREVLETGDPLQGWNEFISMLRRRKRQQEELRQIYVQLDQVHEFDPFLLEGYGRQLETALEAEACQDDVTRRWVMTEMGPHYYSSAY